MSLDRIKKLGFLSAFAVSVAFTGFVGDFSGQGIAFAQEAEEESYAEKMKTRKVPSMSLPVHKKVTKAQEFIELEQYAEANEILAELETAKRVNDYERSVVYQLRAQIAYAQDDTMAAIEAYEAVLALKDSIPVQQEIGLTFNLSQLWYSVDKFDKAVDYYTTWEERATTISVSQRMYAAQLYYVREEYADSIKYVDLAIEEASALDTVEVQENWYGLKLSAHWELGEFAAVRDVLEILIITWPKPSYWLQLAGVYGELGQEQVSFSITEAAYKQGFLDEEPMQLVNLAQILIAREAAVKAAWLLDDALAKEHVEASARNNRTLGQAWLISAEYAKAIGPLSIAARGDKDLDADGAIWSQIGQVLNQLDRLDEAVDAFKKAEDFYQGSKDGKDTARLIAATMQKATAMIELKRFDEAKKALNAAKRLSGKQKKSDSRKTKRQIGQWEKYLVAEKSREDILSGASR